MQAAATQARKAGAQRHGPGSGGHLTGSAPIATEDSDSIGRTKVTDCPIAAVYVQGTEPVAASDPEAAGRECRLCGSEIAVLGTGGPQEPAKHQLAVLQITVIRRVVCAQALPATVRTSFRGGST